MKTFDVVTLDAVAVRESVRVVDLVTPQDLRRPTPCAGWTVLDLLAHMTAQHRGFAAAAGGADDLAVWAVRPPGPDPVGDHRSAAGAVLAAFAADGVLDRTFALPEVAPGLAVPARRAIGFHLVDYVVHAWDVARSIGAVVSLPPEVLEAALQVASRVPTGSSRTRPGAAFAPPVEGPRQSLLDEVVAVLGRSPAWPD